VFNIRSQLLEFARFKSAVMTDDKTRNDDPFGVYFETNNPDRCGVGNMVWFQFEEVSRYGKDGSTTDSRTPGLLITR
jgi:hypothetical protein